jgi:sortase (surface protein transpeptidase)
VKAEPKSKKEKVAKIKGRTEAQEGKSRQGRAEAQEGKVVKVTTEAQEGQYRTEVEIPDIVPEETQLEVVIPVYSASVERACRKNHRFASRRRGMLTSVGMVL